MKGISDISENNPSVKNSAFTVVFNTIHHIIVTMNGGGGSAFSKRV